MNALFTYLHHINNILWGLPLLIILLGTHLYFTIYLKGIQRYTFRGIHYCLTPETGKKGANGFSALAAMLAATLGTGNIIGISTAVAAGGPGAIFWCLITGILGMSTSYAECYLSIAHRKPGGTDSQGKQTYRGGPMFVLMQMGRKKLALFYAFAIMGTSFGVGVTTQINAVSTTLFEFYHLKPWIPGFLGAICVMLVIIKGNQAIRKICTALVPAMSLFYIAACLVLLFLHREYILQAVSLILRDACSLSAAGGGALGGGIMLSMRYGVARGLYTSEAGLGSSAIAAASANTDNPSRQALISMTASFWDTIVMCTLTGIVIVTNLLANPECISYSDGSLTTAAFLSLSTSGVSLLSISLCAFALATMIGWYSFGWQAVNFIVENTCLGRKKSFLPALYQLVYVLMVFAGAILTLETVWEVADFFNALLVLPNIYALFMLRKQIQLPEHDYLP